MSSAARDPAIAAVLKRPFPEQVAFFRAKLGKLVPTQTWRDLWQAEHDKAFMVAGAAKADLLADLASAVDKGLFEGGTIQSFRRDFDAIVARHGWDFKGGRNWRTRVIYTTNAATSYAAGRLAQLQAFPLWVYKHNDSVLHPRPIHLSWDGLTLPREHPFWQTHYPPNGWGCFPADTRVRCSALLGQRLRYSGEMVEIRTAGGCRLAVTPNHPILTGRGFIAAGEVQAGDQVIGAGGNIDAVLHGIVDDPQPPARAEDLFEALAVQGLRIVPMTPDDFHGDASGGEGEIHIAGADSVLMHVIETAPHELGSEGRFQRATHGRVEATGVASGAPLASLGIKHAVFAEDAPDRRFGDAEPFGDAGLAGQAASVQRENLLLDAVVSGVGGRPSAPEDAIGFAAGFDAYPPPLHPVATATNHNAMALQYAQQGRAAASNLLGELLERNAGLVARDEIVFIRKYQWTGHVFDFTTTTGLIVAGGLVVSNCKCRAFGVSDPELARKLGGNPDKSLPGNWQRIDPKTGAPVGIDAGWAYAPGNTAVDTIRALTDGKLPKLPATIGAALIRSWVESEAFERWFLAPKKSWPLARVPDDDAVRLGAADGARIAQLSADTAGKQRRDHPELSAAEYAQAQSVIDGHTAKVFDGASVIYVREMPIDDGGGHVLVVKATRSGQALWVTSFRRLSRGAAQRDSEIRRLLRKGDEK